MREGLRQELEQEKMLRAEAELRLCEVRQENECCKARLAKLQEDFRKMEEMVREMIQFKSRIDQLKHEKSSLALTYESKMRKYQTYIASLEKENFMLLNELKSVEVKKSERQEEQDRSLSRVLLERVRLLEQENATLSLENEQQRLQYEHCLDQVANQVVQALLAQKNLREECHKLQCRVRELEQQNRALSHIFKSHFPHLANSVSPTLQENCASLLAEGETFQEGRNDSNATNQEPPYTLGQAQSSPSFVCAKESPVTCKSEDSTDSLASLCSDYSIHSAASGIHTNFQSGCHKLNSPSRWLQEPSSVLAPSSSTQPTASDWLYDKRIHPCSIWADLLYKAELGCLSKSPSSNGLLPLDQKNVLCQRLSACLSGHPTSSWGGTPAEGALGGEGAVLEDLKHTFLRESKSNHRRWSILRASSEFGDLDSMETPTDESDQFAVGSAASSSSSSSRYGLNFSCLGERTLAQGLSLLDRSSSSILFPTPASTSNHYDPIMSQFLSSTLIYPPSRPSTLNIVPHIMGDPANNFSYRSLEAKRHEVNRSGNVYEELDLEPQFPPTSTESDSSESRKERQLQDALGCSQYSGESPNCDPSSVGSFSKCHDHQRQECTDTVVRRNVYDHPGNKKYTCLGNKAYPSSPVLPPPCSLDDPGVMEGLQKFGTNDSPLSAEVSEHGKDEGYSTMSSDVQGEVNVEAVSNKLAYPPSAPNIPLGTVIPKATNQQNLNTSFKEYGGSSSSSSKLIREGCQRVDQESLMSRDILKEENERDLKNSSIRSEVKCCEMREVQDADCNTEFECSQLDSGLGDSPLAHRLSSFSEPGDIGLTEDREQMKLVHRASLDPSYDKILTLLTPRGFKGPVEGWRPPAPPQLRSVACNSDLRIETAEKSTFTEPQESFYQSQDLFASDTSLISTELIRATRATSFSCNDATSCDGDCESSCSLLRQENMSYRRSTPALTSEPPSPVKNSRSWYDSVDTYTVTCRYCRNRRQKHGLAFPSRVEALGSLLRAFSDSHLVVKRTFDRPNTLGARADSLGTRCPPLRLNLLPLEHHTSACDLSPASEPNNRSMESNLIHQQGTKSNQQKEEDLSSDSDNDLIEPNGLVEQWLQQGSNQLPSKLQNGYTYDEEEIGNWSFQLSADDLSQTSSQGGSAPFRDHHHWVEHWGLSTNTNSDHLTPSERSSSQRLERIQEGSVEEDFQGDFWNTPLWSGGETTAEIVDQIPNLKSSADTRDAVIYCQKNVRLVEKNKPDKHLNAEKISVEGTIIVTEDLKEDNRPKEESKSRLGDPQTDANYIANDMNDVLQSEMTEFNRDFYRLCSTDSTKSLAMSHRSLPGVECSCSEKAAAGQLQFYKKSSSRRRKSESPMAKNPSSKESTSTCDKTEGVERDNLLKVSSNCHDRDSKHSSRREKKIATSKNGSEKPHSSTSRSKSDRTRIPVISKCNSSRVKDPALNNSPSKISQSTPSTGATQISKLEERRVRSSSSGGSVVNNKTPNLDISPSILLSPTAMKQNSRSSNYVHRSGGPKKSPSKNRSLESSKSTTHSTVSQKLSSLSDPGIEMEQYVEKANDQDQGNSFATQNKLFERTAPLGSTKIPSKLKKPEKLKNSPHHQRFLVASSTASQEQHAPVKLRERVSKARKRSKEGCGTSWVHFETDVDLSDPKARANLLDSMMASSSSSSSESEIEIEEPVSQALETNVLTTEESVEEKQEEVLEHKHHERLHALHRFRRHKKRAADPDAVISFVPRLRSSIIDRHDFYYRFGEKEQEAVACFDFLDDLSTSPSDIDGCDPAGTRVIRPFASCRDGIDTFKTNGYLDALDIGLVNYSTLDKTNRLSLDETRLLSSHSSPHNSFSSTTLNSQDCDHISLSDSCAESYTSSTHSLNRLA